MNRKCVVMGCSMTQNSGVTLHPFPDDEELCQQWTNLSGNQNLVGLSHKELHNSYYMCTRHFSAKLKWLDPDNKINLLDMTNNYVLPSLFLPPPLYNVFQICLGPDIEEFSHSGSSVNKENEILPPSLNLSKQESYVIQEERSKDTGIENLDSLVCRLCFIIKKDVTDIFSKDGVFIQKLNFILPFKIQEGDHLPSKVCASCVKKLEISHGFIQTCILADRSFRLKLKETQDEDSTDSMPPVLPELNTNDQLKGISYDDNSSNAQSCSTFKNNYDVHMSPTTSFDLQLSPTSNNSCDEHPLQSSDTRFKVTASASKKSDELSKNSEDTFNLSQFLCHLCNIDCYQSYLFKIHMQNIHKLQSIFECEKCYIFFSSKERLRDHNIELHDEELRVANAVGQNLAVRKNRNRKAKYSPAEQMARKREAVKQRRLKKKKEKIPVTHRKCGYCEIQLKIGDKRANEKHKAEHIAKIKAQQILDSSIQCTICKSKFLTEKSKLNHMRKVHKIDHQFECHHCGKKYFHKKSFMNHIREHILPVTSINLLCDLCGTSCKTKKTLYCHLRNHKSSKCVICSKEMTLSRMKGHMDFFHYKDRKIRCLVCGHSFYTEQEKEEHRLCHENSQYECYVCGNLFKNVENFFSHTQNHLQMSLSKKLTCPVKLCRTQFILTEDFLRHCDNDHSKEDFLPQFLIKRCDKTNTLFCTICDQSFRHFNIYLEHLKMHGESILLCCNICQFSVETEEKLFVHLESHPEAFDFYCRHCKFVFVNDTLRSDHEITIHQGGHQCNVCFKIISEKEMFVLHKNTCGNSKYDLIHTCELCGKKYAKKEYLRKHLLLHSSNHSDELFACTICDRKYMLLHKLKLHMKMTHTT